jgi:hypothetical protein
LLQPDNTVDVYLGGNYPASTDPDTGQSFDAEGNPLNPDLTRLADTPPDFSDQGLLQTLSEDDLAQTDIYFYRVSSGQLIAKLTELGQKRIFRDAKQFTYRQLVPGPEGTLNDSSAPFIYRNRLGQWQEQLGLEPDFQGYQVNQLHPREQVKIIAVNRPTGYIGTAITTLQNPTGGNLDFPIPPLALQPPNLKIKVERVYQVDAGLTRGETPKRQIGFEGSALTSDLQVELSTEWFDQDGSPLPADLEGYTGRLAKVTGPNSLEGGAVATFGIHPGKHLQVLSFQGDYLGSEHMYVHVFGTPEWETLGLGAGAGALQYRPDHYVPVQVPIFDEVTTRRLRNSAVYTGQSADSVPPVYRWPYRPEMQFSVFDLAVQGLEVQDTNNQTQLIDISGDPQSGLLNQLLSDNTASANLLYDLLDPDNAQLPTFGPDRELVFSLGAEETQAILTPGGNVQFDNLAHLAQLNSEDYFAIRLYQNSDSENVLWEYEFGTGLYVISSSNEESKAAKSFVIRNTEDPIKVQWIAELEPTDTVQWKVEALSGLRDPNVPDDLGNLTNAEIKKTMYGKIQAQSFRGANAGGNNGTGKHGDPWLSDIRSAGSAAQQQQLKEIWFKPDMSDHPHPQWQSSEDGLSAHKGTRKIDVRNNGVRSCLLPFAFLPLRFS